MIFWILFGAVFGLVGLESGDWRGLAIFAVIFVVFAPITSRLGRKARAGGKRTWDIQLVMAVLIIPLIVAILANWRGQ